MNAEEEKYFESAAGCKRTLDVSDSFLLAAFHTVLLSFRNKMGAHRIKNRGSASNNVHVVNSVLNYI